MTNNNKFKFLYYFQLLQDLLEQSDTAGEDDEPGQPHVDGATGGDAPMQTSAHSPGGGDATGHPSDPDSVGGGDVSLELVHRTDPEVNIKLYRPLLKPRRLHCFLLLRQPVFDTCLTSPFLNHSPCHFYSTERRIYFSLSGMRWKRT